MNFVCKLWRTFNESNCCFSQVQANVLINRHSFGATCSENEMEMISKAFQNQIIEKIYRNNNEIEWMVFKTLHCFTWWTLQIVKKHIIWPEKINSVKESENSSHFTWTWHTWSSFCVHQMKQNSSVRDDQQMRWSFQFSKPFFWEKLITAIKGVDKIFLPFISIDDITFHHCGISRKIYSSLHFVQANWKFRASSFYFNDINFNLNDAEIS